jgi:hypothetical protein
MPAWKFKTACLTASALAVVSLGIVVAKPQAAAAPPGQAKEAQRIELNDLWLDLEKGELDASRALLKLYDQPKEAVAFLERRMKPLKIDEEQVRALLDWLGSDRDEIWKPAFEQLEYLDPRLAIDIVTLMAEVKEAPARQRMVEVMSGRQPGSLGDKTVNLGGIGRAEGMYFESKSGTWWAENKVARINAREGWNNPKKKWTRAVRAIVFLEHVRTPGAIAILEDMATGHPDAQPTRTAKEALERIAAKAH